MCSNQPVDNSTLNSDAPPGAQVSWRCMMKHRQRAALALAVTENNADRRSSITVPVAPLLSRSSRLLRIPGIRAASDRTSTGEIP